jgi:hypothetical protein
VVLRGVPWQAAATRLRTTTRDRVELK